MNGEVIYEGKHENKFYQDCEQPNNLANSPDTLPSSGASSDFLSNILSNVVMVAIPERMKQKDLFIAVAKEISEKYWINLVITDYEDHVAATYDIEPNSECHFLKGLIQQADEFSFDASNERIQLSLLYYTHATYSSGRLISPFL